MLPNLTQYPVSVEWVSTALPSTIYMIPPSVYLSRTFGKQPHTQTIKRLLTTAASGIKSAPTTKADCDDSWLILASGNMMCSDNNYKLIH
jgi:hypothetical protein